MFRQSKHSKGAIFGIHQIFCKQKHAFTPKTKSKLSMRRNKQWLINFTCPEGCLKNQEDKSCMLYLQYLCVSEGTNIKIPLKEGHVINKSFLGFFFLFVGEGKYLGRGGTVESSEKLWSTLQMLNYKFTGFVKIESIWRNRNVKPLCKLQVLFFKYVVCVCVSGHVCAQTRVIIKR